jgi:hypothetical protein
MAATQRCCLWGTGSAALGIVLGFARRPKGPVVGFGGVCRVPSGGLRANDDGDE